MAIVSNATLPNMTVLETTLANAVADAKTANVQAPSIICVGRNVHLRKAIDWASLLEGKAPRDLDPLGTREISDAS